jgi:hypothetical protein
MTSHRPARDELDEALEEAASHGLTVHDDGSVSYPAAGGAAGEHRGEGGTLTAPSAYVDEFITRAMALIDPNPNRAKAQAIADRIARALHRARADDSESAAVTSRLRAQPGLGPPDAEARR